MKEKFCPYCQQFRLDPSWKTVHHGKTGSKRNMCSLCQEIRKKSRDELNALAEKERAERKRK